MCIVESQEHAKLRWILGLRFLVRKVDLECFGIIMENENKYGFIRDGYFEFEWVSLSDYRFFCRGLKPPGDSKIIVCLIHGQGEHSGRYAHLANYLHQHSIGFMSFDLRGHGRSHGKRGHTPNCDILMEDLSSFVAEVIIRFPDHEIFLYGHSMGGNLVARFAIEKNPPISGVILSGAWFKLAFEPSPEKLIIGNLLNKIWPSFKIKTGLKSSQLTRDDEFRNRYKGDKLSHRYISARLFDCIRQNSRWVIDNAKHLSTPLLVMHGTEDKVTDLKSSFEFASRVPDKAEFKAWEGYYHELHNDTNFEKVLEYVVSWILARVINS